MPHKVTIEQAQEAIQDPKINVASHSDESVAKSLFYLPNRHFRFAVRAQKRMGPRYSGDFKTLEEAVKEYNQW